MPLEKLTAFTKKVADLADKPNQTMSAAEVKAQFDAAPDEVRTYLNQVIDVLQSETDEDSGADNIKVTAITDLTGSTVQELLESLKALDDSNRQYLLNQIGNTVLGQIPDSSITDVKLSDEPTEIKSQFNGHKADYVKHPGAGTTTNVGNTYSVTLNPAPTAYVANMGIVATINADSTAASTLNVNSLGAKPILKSNGNVVSNLKTNGVYTVRYNPAGNGGTGAFILQGEGASGNAVASDLRSGKTASTDAGDIVGTLDLSNVVPGNIKSGVTIDGVTGTVLEGGMSIPLGYNFTSKRITGIDSQGKIYLISTASPWNGYIYDKNMNLLQTITPIGGNTIRGLTIDGYIETNGNNSINIKNYAGTILATINVTNIGTGYPVLRGTNVLWWNPATSNLVFMNSGGSTLCSISVPSDATYMLNKKNNIVYMGFSASVPNKIGIIPNGSSSPSEIQGISLCSASFDMQNW